jgi:hypothetical protein
VRLVGRGEAGKLNATKRCFISKDGFTVETPQAITKIKSVGLWIIPIAVHAMPLKRLMSKLPASEEITLLYFDGWLSVGSVKLSAFPTKHGSLDGDR